MISFELSEEQSIMKSSVARFAQQVLRPLARQVDDAGAIPIEVFDQLWEFGFVQVLIEQAAEAQPGSAVSNAIALEELGWADAAFAVALGAPLGFVRAIAEQGTGEQKGRFLPLFSGPRYRAAAIAHAESGLLATVGASGTVAVSDPHGYRISGHKIQVPFASECSHFLVIARYGDTDDAFIVAADAPGVSVDAPQGLLGLAACRLSSVRFEEVHVDAGMRLGGPGGADLRRILDAGLTGSSAALTGLCRGVYEHSVGYTKDRVAHGTALAQKQSVAFRLVDMFVETEASRWMCWRAASALDQRRETIRSAVLAHTYATEQAAWISDEGVQLMGGHGFMQENPVELWYRNTKTLSMLDTIVSV